MTGFLADVESILKQPGMPKDKQILMFGGPATTEVQHLEKKFLRNSLLITRKWGRSGSNLTIFDFLYTEVFHVESKVHNLWVHRDISRDP